MLKLYSTHCPNCLGIEKMLQLKKIEVEVIEDKDEVLRVAKEQDIKSAPFAEIDGVFLTKEEILKWIKANS